MNQLFLPAFQNPLLARQHDASVFEVAGQRLAMTTDSYVVRPRVFPGGDLGSLAVHGTVNDLAMAGARPLHLSAGVIIEEGLPMAALWETVNSMKQAAEAQAFRSLPRHQGGGQRQGDGLFINTTGMRIIEHSLEIGPRSVQNCDVVLVSGDLGRHGMAVMAVREGLSFESAIESDFRPRGGPRSRPPARRHPCPLPRLRDLTPGRPDHVLNEIAEASGLTLAVEESLIPVPGRTFAPACEFLGLDPPPGRLRRPVLPAFLPPSHAEPALKILRRHPVSANACRIGAVTGRTPPRVLLRQLVGPSVFWICQPANNCRAFAEAPPATFGFQPPPDLGIVCASRSKWPAICTANQKVVVVMPA